MSEGDGNTERPDHGPMDQFSAHLDRGWDLIHRGDLAGAQRSAEKSLELDAESPEAHNLLGYVSAALGELERAKLHLGRAIEQEPDAADVHYYMGLVLDAQGSHEGATVAFLRCRELDSSTLRPQWNLSQGQFERQLRRAIERLAPDQRDVLEGALIVVSDLPGAEVVADGVDPRAVVLLDALSERDATPRAGRAF